MRTSSTTLKSSIQKKKQPVSNANTDTISIMNKTSLSSISSSSQSDKLSQLKQKLQKQRQTMRTTGRRFRDSTQSTSTEIQIQTQPQSQVQNEQNKPNKPSKPLMKSTKVSTGTGGGLYDFNSLKSQVQNKTKGMFIKKAHVGGKDKSDLMVPVYTTKQILEMEKLAREREQQLQAQRTNERKFQRPEVNREEIKRDTINLMELSGVISSSTSLSSPTPILQSSPSNGNSQNQPFVTVTKHPHPSSSQHASILNNSHIFQTAIKQQKERNKEVRQFLAQVGLQRFADDLISLGFDQIDTLIEIGVEELNLVRMRAKEQDKLITHIKQYKRTHQIQETVQENTLPKRQTKTKALQLRSVTSRPKSSTFTTQPSQSTPNTSRLLSTSRAFNASQSTLSNKSSIFYFMGGQQWSLQSQVRKACSGCFKVSYTAMKRGQCYYCQNCDPGETLDISLDESMVRSYR